MVKMNKLKRILANDIFDELKEENRRILRELIFANKCLNSLIEFKQFVDFLSIKFQFNQNLETNDYKKYCQLSKKSDQDFKRKKDVSSQANLPRKEVPKKCSSVTLTTVTPVTEECGEESVTDLTDERTESDRLSDDSDVRITTEDNDRGDSQQDNNQTTNNCYILLPSTINNRVVPPLKIKTLTKITKDKPRKKKKEKRTIRYTELRSDLKNGRRKEILICDINDCRKQYKTERGMTAHKIGYHSKINPFICDHPNCHFETGYLRSLQRHVKKHDKSSVNLLTIRQFKCTGDGCEGVFDTEVQLDEHMKECSRSQNKIYTCPHKSCPKTFTSKSRFDRHSMFIHSPDPIYACEFTDCRFWAFRPSALKTHMSTHFSIKEYRCKWPDCDFVALQKTDLRDHKRLNHSIQYVCDRQNCNREFRTERFLRLHMKVHNSEEFICEYPNCGRRYLRWYAMKRHYHKYHPFDDE